MHSAQLARRAATDVDLWKLAEQQPASRTAATTLLRTAGIRANDALALALLDRAAQVRRLRSNRQMRRIVERLGHEPLAVARPATPPGAAVLPAGTPATRLASIRVVAITSAARRALRYGAAGGHSMRVRLTGNPQEVGYTVTFEKNYQNYRGRFKGWPAAEDHHLIVVPADWRLRVQRRGLATLGGMLTLDAHELMNEQPGVRLFAAVWARQARGFNVAVERGYIAVNASESYHADTIEAAVRGLRRKEAAAESWTDDSSAARFLARYDRHRGLPITLDDARATGACEYGIRAWCDAVGLCFAAGTATVGQVLDGYEKRPQVEVRRAVRYAVHRHRNGGARED